MKIAIFGAGAIGSYIAGKLSLVGAEITVFARGEHGRVMAAKGLTLADHTGTYEVDVTVASSAADIGAVDAVLVTTKNHHHKDIAQHVLPVLDDDTPVVFAVNGLPWWYGAGLDLPGISGDRDPARAILDPDKVLTEGIGAARTVGCVVYSSNTIEKPGFVRNGMEVNRYYLSALDSAMEARITPLKALFAEAGILGDEPGGDDVSIRQRIWKKLVYSMSLAPVATLTELTNGQLRDNEALMNLMRQVGREGAAVAAAHGFDVTPDLKLPGGGRIANHRQSMLQDALLERRIEFEPMVSLPLLYGRAAGLSCPMLETIAVLLQARFPKHDLVLTDPFADT
ncbi:MAG: ketopantoate reductase family protein [Methyloligellaceae bacterium]